MLNFSSKPMQVMFYYTLSLFVLPLGVVTCWLMCLVTGSVFYCISAWSADDTHVCVVMPTRMYSFGLNLRSVKEPFFLSDPFILGWPLVQFPISTSKSSLFHSGRLVTASASFPPLYKIQSCNCMYAIKRKFLCFPNVKAWYQGVTTAMAS